MRGHNADPVYEHSLDHCLEFFSKAGSMRKNAKLYYDDAQTRLLQMFQLMWIVPELRKTAMQLLFWLRDPRGGAGNRSGFRECLRWLATDAPGGKEWIRANFTVIPEYGRVDDWETLFGTTLEADVAEEWKARIIGGDHFALKWAKRHHKPLQKAFDTNEAGLRKILAAAPNRKTVENIMCSNMIHCSFCKKETPHMRKGHRFDRRLYLCEVCGAEYEDYSPWHIPYSHVPSVAMKMYNKAFLNHDKEGFEKYIEDLKTGKAKVNASVLFPHDCYAAVQKDNADLANAQFNALPNYIPAHRRIMVLCDTSGSMAGSFAGGASLLTISLSLALYCSDRIGDGNPFYRKYMEFSERPVFKDWAGITYAEALDHDGYCGNTNIELALNYLLSMGKMFNATRDQMPTMLMIISDMQFDVHSGDDELTKACEGTERTVVEKCMAAWEAEGFTKPGIVYWNLGGYAGSPATCQTPNTCLISGFSPSILTSVLEDETFDAVKIMEKAISKYSVTLP